MKNVSIYIDLMFCLIVLPVMVMIFPVERWYHNFQWYVITVGFWLYALYFVNRIFTVPALFRAKKSRLVGIVLILVSFGITFMLAQISLYIPKPNVHDEGIVRIFPSIQLLQAEFLSVHTGGYRLCERTVSNPDGKTGGCMPPDGAK